MKECDRYATSTGLSIILRKVGGRLHARRGLARLGIKERSGGSAVGGPARMIGDRCNPPSAGGGTAAVP